MTEPKIEPGIKPDEPKEELDPKIQEQIDKGVSEGIEKAKEELKPEPEPEPEPDEKSYVDSSYKPDTWNKVFKRGEEISREAAREEFKKVREEEKEEMDKINDGFDKQLNELRDGGADIDKDTEKEIFQLGRKLGSANIKELYTVLKATKEVKKEKEVERTLDLAKKASLVGSGNAPGKSKVSKSYADIAGKSMDDLIDEEFGEE